MGKNAIETMQFSGMMQPAKLIFKKLHDDFTESTIAAKNRELCIAKTHQKKPLTLY